MKVIGTYKLKSDWNKGWFHWVREELKPQHLLSISFPQCSGQLAPPPSSSSGTQLSALWGPTHPSPLSPYPYSACVGPIEQFARTQREETPEPCTEGGGREPGGPGREEPWEASSIILSLWEGGRVVCFQNISCHILSLPPGGDEMSGTCGVLGREFPCSFSNLLENCQPLSRRVWHELEGF